MTSQTPSALNDIKVLFERTCAIAGTPDIIERARADLSISGVLEAVLRHDDEVLFNWLMAAVSYQGIGDSVAASYMETHGRIGAADVAAGLSRLPSCEKLAGYWAYVDCRYHKGSKTCAEPEHFDHCPVPRHDLRNGRLNQTAYSLHLFFRDIGQGDFVAWIDLQLNAVAQMDDATPHLLRRALLEPLAHVHGISNKVLSMALADLLLAVGADRPLWFEAGTGMVAVDSLVHNWLHRTGVLAKLECEHPYGSRCYGPNGCAVIIGNVSALIDARTFNTGFPKIFPRFVQKAIWWFCAQAGLDQCNGNRIDDREPCAQLDCLLNDLCEHRVLVRI